MADAPDSKAFWGKSFPGSAHMSQWAQSTDQPAIAAATSRVPFSSTWQKKLTEKEE
jgi:hypothetical protein